jgi:hypothetical protein
MTIQLRGSARSIAADLTRGAHCEKALLQTAVADETDGEVYVENGTSPTFAFAVYNNEATVVGEPPSIETLDRFIAGILQYRRYRMFSHVGCPSTAWRDRLLALRSTRLRCAERIAYTYSCGSALKPNANSATPEFALRAMDYDLADSICAESHSDFYDFRAAWKSPDEFARRGIGYCVVAGNEVASVAFSCFPVTQLMEIATATKGKFRRLGLASAACAKLMEYCLLRDIEPLWSCYASNVASNDFAKRLGFGYDHTYYWLYERGPSLREVFMKVREWVRP